MSNKENTSKKKTLAYTFGDPEPVLNNNLADYLGVFLQANGEYFEPPVSLSGLGKLLRANAHHGAVLPFKRNLLAKNFLPSKGLSRQTLIRAGLDYLVFGMVYFQCRLIVRREYDFPGAHLYVALLHPAACQPQK